jgi:LemA protein
MATGGALLLVVVVVVWLVVLAWTAGTYNGFVRLRNLVQEAWRQIDVELRRRYDLIPNLVETVRGYAAHERETMEAVVQARAAAAVPGSSLADLAQRESALSAALGRLFAVAEAYPQLRANESFLALQRELTETEDRVAAGRRFYNANVRGLNTKVETFPANLVARSFGFTRAEYFETEDAAVRGVPALGLGSTTAAPAASAGWDDRPPGASQEGQAGPQDRPIGGFST